MTDTTALLEAITADSRNATDLSSVKRKAYAWARVSTEEQDKRGESITQQLREIRAYAERNDIEIVEEFSEAVSAFGNGEKRFEFNRMTEKAKADPEINTIIVHDFSRFSRDSLNGRVLLRDLRNDGIKVMSVTDPDVDPETTAGIFTESVTFANNEAYSRKIARDTIRGCKGNLRARDPETKWGFKNGAPALYGYKIKHIEYGIGKGGKPILKSIWELNDTVVAGKPIHEWVRYCLLELALKGAGIAKLRDFCNDNKIPGRSNKHWSTISWRDLLLEHNILKYAGYGVWNVKGPKSRRRPPSEWEVVENAHEAIITKEEAFALIKVRQELRKKFPGPGKGRARQSRFLLTGGIFKCSRCGKNLVGHKTYYVCGSEPYRAGRGCGEGVYVPQLLLETEVIKDIQEIISKFADPDRFTKKVNEELRRIWEQESGYDPNAEKRIREIDKKINHIRGLLLDGLDDVEWANQQLQELRNERDTLSASLTKADKPIQVDSKKAMECRTRLGDVLDHGSPVERKEYVQKWVDRVTLLPDEREIQIQYRVPESVTNAPIMNSDGMGSRATSRCSFIKFLVIFKFRDSLPFYVTEKLTP